MFEGGRGDVPRARNNLRAEAGRLISSRYGAPFPFPGTLPYRRRMSPEFLPYLPAAKETRSAVEEKVS